MRESQTMSNTPRLGNPVMAKDADPELLEQAQRIVRLARHEGAERKLLAKALADREESVRAKAFALAAMALEPAERSRLLAALVVAEKDDWVAAALDGGADANAPVDPDGTTALMLALERPSREAAARAMIAFANPEAARADGKRAIDCLDCARCPLDWVAKLKGSRPLSFDQMSKLLDRDALSVETLRSFEDGVDWLERPKELKVVGKGGAIETQRMSLLDTALLGGWRLDAALLGGWRTVQHHVFEHVAKRTMEADPAIARELASETCLATLQAIDKAPINNLSLGQSMRSYVWCSRIAVMALLGMLPEDDMRRFAQTARKIGAPKPRVEALVEQIDLGRALAEAGSADGRAGGALAKRL
jgi:hypothetical protein